MTDIVADDPRFCAPARKPAQAWNAATKRWFLELLMDFCSVSRALATMGMAPSALYAARKKDKKFRDAWDEVIEFGYARLEAELFDRALNGHEREVIHPSGEKTTLRQVANALGLSLLRLYAPRIAAIRALHGPGPSDDAMEAKIEIIKKLDAIARHRAKYGHPKQAAAQAPPPV